MTTLEILTAARDLIAHRDHWIQGALSRNAHGMIVEPTAADAVQWCVTGACRKTADGYLGSLARAISRLCHTLYPNYAFDDWTDKLALATTLVGEWNDRPEPGRHADVIALLDRAIEEEKR